MYGIPDETANKVADLEKQIVTLQAELAKTHKERPARPVEDYELTRAADGSKVKLSELLGDRERLLVVHNMGKSCPYCTMWADGFNGLAEPLQERMAFVVASPDAPGTQSDFAGSRNWSLPMVSTQGTSFAKDLGFEMEQDGKTYLMPGASVFRKSAGGEGVELLSQTPFGPGDRYNPVFQFADLAGLSES